MNVAKKRLALLTALRLQIPAMKTTYQWPEIF